MLRKLRLTAALVLLGAAFLPLSECSQEPNHLVTGPKSIRQRLYPQSTSDVSYQYAYKSVALNGFTAFTVIAFTWPLLFLLLARRQMRGKKVWIFRVLEVLLSGGAIYWVNVLTYHSFGATWLYGAYIAVAALSIFALCGIAEWFKPPLPVPETAHSGELA